MEVSLAVQRNKENLFPGIVLVIGKFKKYTMMKPEANDIPAISVENMTEAEKDVNKLN